MNAELSELINEVLERARKQGLTQKQLGELSRLGEVAISRLKSADDARFSTLQTLGRSLGMRLVWVDDSTLAELVTRGELFD
mgnify:CR=1 FL=1